MYKNSIFPSAMFCYCRHLNQTMAFNANTLFENQQQVNEDRTVFSFRKMLFIYLLMIETKCLLNTIIYFHIRRAISTEGKKILFVYPKESIERDKYCRILRTVCWKNLILINRLFFDRLKCTL